MENYAINRNNLLKGNKKDTSGKAHDDFFILDIPYCQIQPFSTHFILKSENRNINDENKIYKMNSQESSPRENHNLQANELFRKKWLNDRSDLNQMDFLKNNTTQFPNHNEDKNTALENKRTSRFLSYTICMNKDNHNKNKQVPLQTKKMCFDNLINKSKSKKNLNLNKISSKEKIVKKQKNIKLIINKLPPNPEPNQPANNNKCEQFYHQVNEQNMNRTTISFNKSSLMPSSRKIKSRKTKSSYKKKRQINGDIVFEDTQNKATMKFFTGTTLNSKYDVNEMKELNVKKKKIYCLKNINELKDLVENNNNNILNPFNYSFYKNPVNSRKSSISQKGNLFNLNTTARIRTSHDFRHSQFYTNRNFNRKEKEIKRKEEYKQNYLNFSDILQSSYTITPQNINSNSIKKPSIQNSYVLDFVKMRKMLPYRRGIEFNIMSRIRNKKPLLNMIEMTKIQ